MTREREAKRTEARKATRIREKVQEQHPASHLRKFAETTSRARAKKVTDANTSIRTRAVIGRRDLANGRRDAVSRTV